MAATMQRSRILETSKPPHAVQNLKVGEIPVVTELHITGGIRAGWASDRMWRWEPALIDGELRSLQPQSINRIADLADAIGGTLFGGDEITGIGTSLLSRVWTPLDGPNSGKPEPAVIWRAISGNASDAGDQRYAVLASHIAFSLNAAGIRLRDASDHYRDQLLAAIENGRKPGDCFSNVPMFDIHIAFHSVLSELASARDYLASTLAYRLGAPEKIDALNRFHEWLSAESRAAMRNEPIVADVLAAYATNSPDPWLHELTQYRNLFLHRKPLGSSGAAKWLRFDHRYHEDLTIPIIQMPLGEEDPSAPGQDALMRFIGLYRKMVALLSIAAASAPYSSVFPSFVADGSASSA